MRILSAEFVKSAYDRRHWTTGGLPEIAFLGRSNVGKSSLINSLLQRKGLARTSNTPGRTQSINFFLINESFYFVDLPGYGFAKVSRSTRQEWGPMAEQYLSEREELALSIHLVDSRHEPTALDRQLHEWLLHHDKQFLTVATKADKLSGNQLQKQLKIIKSNLPGGTILAYSAVNGYGKDALWSAIVAEINNFGNSS